ncbi:3'(2'),5'-bisphosphate nucleotidase CysQ [Pusillimonas sp. TS35]|nr:3'(2'),5'-bisphosphate nucleotidase CysQ [Pusillimonas sp. TS35]
MKVTGIQLDYAELLERLVPVVQDASQVVMQVYKSNFSVSGKADLSPVTEADCLAEALLIPRLQQLLPMVPVVAEEGAAVGHMPAVGSRFWLVDPVDGTREFISRHGEFTVNVALVENGSPVLGVVHAPALGCLYAGAVGSGAFRVDEGGRQVVACRARPEAGLVVMASRSHGSAELLDAFLGQQQVGELRNAGSSLKFCLVATGEADVYPRFGRTMEWDTAAGHAVLLAAGGRVVDVHGGALVYGKPGFENPHFIAWGRGE